MFGRQKVAALFAEFLGTGVLTLLILNVKVASSLGQLSLFVGLAAAVAYIIMSFAVGSKSGAYFNPALTIGAWTVRKISTVNAVLYIAFQLLGAWAAYYLYTYFVQAPMHSNVLPYNMHVLVAEAVGTGIFAFAFASAVYQGFSRAVSATVAGLGLLVGTVAVSTASLALLNPAVALGLRSWAWTTYVAGPVIGAVIGFNLYSVIFTDAGLSKLSALFSSSSSRTAVAQKSVAKKKTVSKKK